MYFSTVQYQCKDLMGEAHCTYQSEIVIYIIIYHYYMILFIPLSDTLFSGRRLINNQQLVIVGLIRIFFGRVNLVKFMFSCSKEILINLSYSRRNSSTVHKANLYEKS